MESLNPHPTDDELEGYGMKTLPDSEIERIESHFLLCSQCRREFERIDEERRRMRETLENLRTQSDQKGSRQKL